MSNRQDQPYGVISLTLKRWNRGILITLLLVAFTLRALPLDVQGLWRDEVDALRFATAPLEELLGNFDRPGWNGPLYFLILRGWILLTGRSAFAMRYFSLLWSIVGIALFYVLGRRVVGHKTALWALPLVVFSPYLVWYAQEIKMYTWVPTLVLLALYALDRACTRPRWVWWAVVLATTSMAFYSHILAALLIPVEVIWFLLHPRRQRRAWIGGLITLALLTLPYVPLLRWQWREVWKIRETGFPTFTLEEMVQILLTGWSTGIAAWASGAGAVFFSTLALFGLVAVIYWQGLRRELTLLTWLLLPLFAIWAVSQQGPIFTDRYLIWTAPAFYLLVSAGLRLLARLLRLVLMLPLTLLNLAQIEVRARARVAAWLQIFIAIVLLLDLIAFASVNLGKQIATPIKPEFQKVAAHLRRRREPSDLLLFQIPYNHIMVDYYLDPPLDPWAEGPYTNWRTPEGTYVRTPEEVDTLMRDIVRDHEEVWLVYSEATMWDERQLVKSWLDEHAQLLDEQHFHLVDLYQYKIPHQVSMRGPDPD